MFTIIFLLIITGCDKVSLNRREDKVLPMLAGDFEKELNLSNLLDIQNLIDVISLKVRLDRELYEEIKRRSREESLGEVVDVALNEEKMRKFLLQDNIDVEINREINIEVEGESGYTYMLHLAVENDFHPDTIGLMLEKGALLSKIDSEGNTPLFIAIGREVVNHEILSLLLSYAYKRGVDTVINQRNNRGMTLLQYALSMKEENRDLVEHILSLGADIRVRNEQEGGLNALHYAVLTGNVECVRLILANIEDIEERREYIRSVDEYGRTALHFASILGDFAILSILSKEFEEEYIFVQDKMGATDLHYIALNKEIKSRLIEIGLERE